MCGIVGYWDKQGAESSIATKMANIINNGINKTPIRLILATISSILLINKYTNYISFFFRLKYRSYFNF